MPTPLAASLITDLLAWASFLECECALKASYIQISKCKGTSSPNELRKY